MHLHIIYQTHRICTEITGQGDEDRTHADIWSLSHTRYCLPKDHGRVVYCAKECIKTVLPTLNPSEYSVLLWIIKSLIKSHIYSHYFHTDQIWLLIRFEQPWCNELVNQYVSGMLQNLNEFWKTCILFRLNKIISSCILIFL